jgi:hypothetical protein
MNKKNTIKVSLGVLVIFALLFSTVPAQAATTYSHLTVITQPGVKIYVDGVLKDQCYGYYITITVTQGSHVVKVFKPNYYPVAKTAVISSTISYVYMPTLIHK